MTKQNKDVQELLRLIQENPELEIIPMVDTELLTDDWAWVRGWWGKAEVDEYWEDEAGERIYLRSRDEDEAMDEMMNRIYCAKREDNWSDAILEEKAREIIRWKKAIVVWIGP